MDERKLKDLPLFRSLGKRELRKIASYADEVDVPEGTELLHQGNFAHEFMVVEDGHAEVVRDGERIAELGPGDFLGEIAALEGGTRTATVVARSPMTLVVMTDGALRQIAREMPEVDAPLRAAAREHCPISAA
jgi:CRP-like cAMP-binding protein